MQAKESPLELLIIEDNGGDARLLRELLKERGAPAAIFHHVGSMQEAELHLAQARADVIVLDLGLPDAHGLAAVRRAHEAAPDVPLVVLTGQDDETLATQSLQQGAQDYLIKGEITGRGLARALRYAIERKHIEGEARRLATALAAEHDLLEVTLQSIGDAVICTDGGGRISFANEAAESLLGRRPPGRANWTVPEVARMVKSCQKQAKAAEAVSGAKPQTRQIPVNYMLRRPGGQEIPVEGCFAPIAGRNGQSAGHVIVFRDVSAAREAARQISHSANHDFLTGLPNRLLLGDRIAQAISMAPRHGKKVAILFLDLDGFKHINDSLGHLIGDKLLKSVASRLVECVRASDTISRQGGDEFVVLLAEMSEPADAALTARRILQVLSEVHVIDEHELYVTGSIGIGVYPDDALDAETLIKAADTAMYQVKESGRRNYQFFEPAMKLRAMERQYIEENLRRAMERGEFALHYQPKFDLANGTITGAEALIRWTHPIRGAIAPADFIPVAEDCGLIRPMGSWVLREACEQAKLWADSGLPAMTMAVNVSAIEFSNQHFLTGLMRILDETGLDPALLELELTESVLMKSTAATEANLKALRRKGIRLAIDDFGTGYSSLSYLTKFPIDTIKIDQSFIRRISAAATETTIVEAVIGMARGLKLSVVAEGVETEAELNFLSQHHCHQAQGYYFSRPVTADRFTELAAARAAPAGVCD